MSLAKRSLWVECNFESLVMGICDDAMKCWIVESKQWMDRQTGAASITLGWIFILQMGSRHDFVSNE